MKRSSKATEAPGERYPEESSDGSQPVRIEMKETAPCMSLIFIKAANNLDIKELTAEKVRQYSLQKYNVDVTKNILNTKPVTRAAIRAEQNKYAAQENMPKDTVNMKQKIKTVVDNRVNDSNEERNVRCKKITPSSWKVKESPPVEEEIAENTLKKSRRGISRDKRKMAQAAKSKVGTKRNVTKNLPKKPKSKVGRVKKKQTKVSAKVKKK